MATTFMGKDGFVWWHGVVENRFDPLMIGRCKVRILGWHTHDKEDMPTSQLPWAYPLMPITSASQTEVGYSPTGPVEGTWVMGFFRDGEAGQEPVMMGTLGGIPESPSKTNVGFNDPRLDIDTTLIDSSVPSGPKKGERRNPIEGTLEGVPYKPKTITLSKGKPVQIGEYSATQGPPPMLAPPERKTYPRVLDQPTTSKYARGSVDPSADVEPDKDGTVGDLASKSGSLKSIIADKQSKSQLHFSAIASANSATPSFSEPESMYEAEYPYNHVFESESGHLIEIDDTPEAERLHWYHRSGTFTEIHPKGTRVDRVHDDKYDMIWKDHRMSVGGSSLNNIGNDYERLSGGGSIIRAGATSTFTVDSGKYDINVAGGGLIITAGIGDSEGANPKRSRFADALTPGDITIAAKNTLHLRAKQIKFGDDKQERTIDGDLDETVKGKASYAAGSLGLSSQTEMSVFSGANIGIMAGGTVSETILNPFVLLGNLNAKKTTTVLGKQVMECIDPLLTGGINLNMGPGGMLSTIAMKPFAMGGSIDITTKGPLGINLEASFPASIAKFKAGLLLDIEAKIVRIVSDLMVEVGKDAKIVMVGGTTDFAVLASQLASVFAAHTHLTANGPSGPPTNAAQTTQFFSKKVMLG